MTRLNKILAVVLGVQLVLAIVMLRRDHGAPVARLAAIAPDLDTDRVTRVQIFGPRERDATAGAAAAPTAAIDLRRDGDAWSLADHFGYPADTAKVVSLLGDLRGMKARGPMTTSAARHVQLGVADDVYQRKVVLTTDAGDRTFYVGQSAGGRRTAVRRDGDDKVYAVGGLSAYAIDATPRGWVDTTYLAVAKDQVASLEVRTPHGTLALDRTLGPWTLAVDGAAATLAAGEALDPTKIDGLLSHLTRLTLAEPGDPARDASQPTATITVRLRAPAAPAPATADGAAADAPVADAPAADAPAAASPAAPEHVLDVIADGDRYWVHERGAPHAAMVDKSQLAGLVELSRDAVITGGTANATAPTAPAPRGAAPGKAPHG